MDTDLRASQWTGVSVLSGQYSKTFKMAGLCGDSGFRSVDGKNSPCITHPAMEDARVSWRKRHKELAIGVAPDWKYFVALYCVRQVIQRLSRYRRKFWQGVACGLIAEDRICCGADEEDEFATKNALIMQGSYTVCPRAFRKERF